MAAVRAALVAASLAAGLAPSVAFADPDPPCRLVWEKPVLHTDENGIPYAVSVDRPYWVC